jgi:hypothetical protein
MSAIDATDQTATLIQGTGVTEAPPRPEVRMVISWSVIPSANAPRALGAAERFDPAAAGRRAVAKHGEALRRLSN